MLKRLELAGFKSFADKTQFDFPPGITGIIGPNGSGKSNVVDAVRWVLGEQSAKSLRGGEMIDVIFNGAAGRRSLGLAEVTMTFDNTRRSLATEAEEVQISRRVYRSGESEYLINGHLSRLKDIKDLFLGSGAGTDAYCIIEQGRVDVLLQASTKERRTIFEEAAGISRFKAKKMETLRRLERVDQNLERLRDIVEEVEKQLRSVKLQAAKAQRFQEYNTRLRSLRVDMGLKEYRQLTEQLSAASGLLDGLKSDLERQFALASAWEQELTQLDQELGHLDESAREREAETTTAARQIDLARGTLTHEWAAVAELESDLQKTRQQLAALNVLVAERSSAVSAAGAELDQVESQCQEHRLDVRNRETRLEEIEDRLAILQEQLQSDKTNHMAQMRLSAHSQNDVVSFKAQIDNLSREKTRLFLRSTHAAEQMASLDLELQELTTADEAMHKRVVDARFALTALRQDRETLELERDLTAQIAADMRAQRSGLASRIEVLENLERSHEGLGSGQREVLELIGQAKPGPWRTVFGILADFLTVRREYAPLIDLALGEQAQRFLVEDDDQLSFALKLRTQPFSGRVSFLPLTDLQDPLSAKAVTVSEKDLEALGVVAWARNVVRCDDARLKDLPLRLLGRTLIVKDLAAARAIAALGQGYRSVTLQGELLEADGTLTVGQHHAESSILSRKSELRELREQAVLLETQVSTKEQDLLQLKEQLVRMDALVDTRQREIDVLAEQAADLRSRLSQHRQKREGLHEEVTVSRSEISGLEQEIERLQAQLDQAREKAARAEKMVQDLQNRVAAAEREIREREVERQKVQQIATEGRVALAQVEERLHAIQARHRQAAADLAQRRQEQARGEDHRSASQQRLTECERQLLEAYAALAHWYPHKEQGERALAEINSERVRLRQRKQERAEQAQSSRAAWRAQQEQAHVHELAVQTFRHQRDTLCLRLREDYQIELADLIDSPALIQESAPTSDPDQAPLDPLEEIEDLRRKLAKLGSVNLEALQELAELEGRAGTLKIQFEDLSSAQQRLQEIIQRINGDSRRLFTETYNTIRTHFQELFRKLFGGGMADIVLEDETDILESGIEIVARPPGKELRGISLMSGGEKTMTAVALLLAIFRSKPSPFCILDEVDAALDEANVSRFTSVLREFLDQSQFIIVTHSKRTMSCADVLYGVTMAESGVSKRMAIKFEDWPDDERRDGGNPAA